MRKTILLTAITIFTINTALAQEISLGLKGGVNKSTFSGSFQGQEAWNELINPQGGLVLNVDYSERLKFQAEIFYSPQGALMSVPDTEYVLDGSVELVAKINYINVPLLVDYHVFKGFSLQGGPQIAFYANSEMIMNTKPLNFGNAKTVALDAAIGAQYRMPLNKLFFGTPGDVFLQVRYAIGISKINKDDYYGDMRNSVFSISIGYFFDWKIKIPTI